MQYRLRMRLFGAWFPAQPARGIAGWDARAQSSVRQKAQQTPIAQVVLIRCRGCVGAAHFPLCKARGLCYTLARREPLRFRLFLGSSAVEHSTVNRMVAGSNPARGAIWLFRRHSSPSANDRQAPQNVQVVLVNQGLWARAAFRGLSRSTGPYRVFFRAFFGPRSLIRIPNLDKTVRDRFMNVSGGWFESRPGFELATGPEQRGVPHAYRDRLPPTASQGEGL